MSKKEIEVIMRFEIEDGEITDCGVKAVLDEKCVDVKYVLFASYLKEITSLHAESIAASAYSLAVLREKISNCCCDDESS